MAPFSESARREMYRRDESSCQNENCICQRLYGRPATWADGFMMNAAHYPDMHQKGIDENIDNGRIIDVHAHIIEEIRRGNSGGARLLHQNQPIRNNIWLLEHSGRDEKMELDWYFAYELCDRDGDERGLQGLIDIFHDTFM